MISGAVSGDGGSGSGGGGDGRGLQERGAVWVGGGCSPLVLGCCLPREICDLD